MHGYKTMIATNRFGLGARPGEAEQAAADPQAWLLRQLDGPDASLINDARLRASDQALADYFRFRDQRRNMKNKDPGDGDAPGEPQGRGRGNAPEKGSPRAEIAAEIEARTRFAASTDKPYRERLVRFWANHFTVSVSKNTVVPVAGAFEREAIRPHVSGNFVDLLIAAETHPAMLLYLDNAQSVGPASAAGKRRGRGLNENLAREILELHTLGVDGGYSQQDVVEFARALTGWTVGAPRDRAAPAVGKTWFDERRHEPGRRVVLGKVYGAGGNEQALLVMRDLCSRPQTARFIAFKLARHFIADEPPAAAVARLERAFLDSAGDLAHVSAQLVRLDEAWEREARKFKTPDEFYISALRGLGADNLRRNALRTTYSALGQPPFAAPSPAGWADEAVAWLGPDAVKKRLEWSQVVASRLGNRIDPRSFVAETLGETASARTRLVISGSDSREQGMTLALMSPEFQRR